MKLRRSLFVGARIVLGLFTILAVLLEFLYYQRLGLYSVPLLIIQASVLALLIRSIIRTTDLETAVIFAVILALEILLVPNVDPHSDRHARSVSRSTVIP